MKCFFKVCKYACVYEYVFQKKSTWVYIICGKVAVCMLTEDVVLSQEVDVALEVVTAVAWP